MALEQFHDLWLFEDEQPSSEEDSEQEGYVR